MSSASLPTLPRLPTIPIVGRVGSGGGETVIEMETLQNFSNGSGALSAAEFNAGLHGTNWGTWSEAHEGNVGVSNTHTNIVDHDIGLPFTLRVDGVDYDGTEGQGAEFDFSTEPTEYDAYQLAPGITVNDMVLMSLERSSPELVSGQETTYSNDLYVLNGGNFSVSQGILNFANQRLAIAHSEGSFGLLVGTMDVWYLKALFRDVTNGQTKVFIQRVIPDGGGWQLGDAIGMSRAVTGSAGSLANIRFQDYLRPARGTGSVKVKLFAMTTSTAFPPWNPGTMTGPSGFNANRTEEEQITLDISGPWALVRIERSVNGGGFSTLVASRDIALESPVFQYVDNAVSVPNTYQYRVVGLVGSYETEAATSAVIDLSEPFAEWTDASSVAGASSTQEITNPSTFGQGCYFDLPAGTATKIRFYVDAITGSIPMKLALYDGSNNLLDFGTVTASATGYVTVDIGPLVITAGTYMVAFHFDVGVGETITERFNGSGPPACSRFGVVDYGDFPLDPLGLESVGSALFVVGVLITPAP